MNNLTKAAITTLEVAEMMEVSHSDLLKKIEDKGIRIEYVTLHVGLGTFRPVMVENIEEHKMHTEYYEMSEETAIVLNKVKESGHKIISVGTTSVRTLETIMNRFGKFQACSGTTNIFIYPGYQFKIADALITNFHLPESTLLMLVSALEGQNEILAAYKEAVSLRYRFFSFGDAMFMETRKLVYNADGTYNQKYYTEKGELKIPYSVYLKEESRFKEQIAVSGIENAWNMFH